MNKFDIQELAKHLDGSEYPFRISSELRSMLAEQGIVIIYGSSDDLIEFDGAIYDEAGAPGEVLFDRNGTILSYNTFLEFKSPTKKEMIDYLEREARATKVISIEGNNPYWRYEIDVPHVTFDILEDGDVYCRGIIFSIDDL